MKPINTTLCSLTACLFAILTTSVHAGTVGQYASVGDFVFEDLNANGVQDAGEPGVESVEVVLSDGITGSTLATFNTGSDGSYGFDMLLPGDYSLVFNEPSGFEFSPSFIGSPDLDSNGFFVNFSLAAGEINNTIDSGLFRPASVGNFVFFDADGDGIQDTGELGIENVFVELLVDANGDGLIDDIVDVTTTDSGGFYSFTGLTPGVEYQLQFGTPAGLGPSPALTGGDPTIDSDGLLSDVVILSSGEFNSTIDAGFVPEPSSLTLLCLGGLLFASRRR